MAFFSLSFLISSLIALVTGVFVLSRSHKSAQNLIFFLYCTVISYIGFCEFEVIKSDTVEEAMFWIYAFSMWPLILPLMLHFVLVFARKKNLLKHSLTYAALYLPAVVLIALRLESSMITIVPVQHSLGWSFHVKQKLASSLIGLWTISMSLISLWICYDYYRKAKDRNVRLQAKFVFVGLLIPVITAMTVHTLVELFKMNLPGMTPIAFVLSVVCFGIAIIRYKLFIFVPMAVADEIVEAMRDALFLIDNDNVIRKTNQAAQDLLGFRQPELERSDFRKILKPAANEIDPLGTHMENLPTPRDDVTEARILSKDGTAIPVSVSISGIADEKGHSRGVVCIARDIRRQKQAEEEKGALEQQLQQAQKMEAIGQLAGGIAHDFNNMLGAITGYSDLLRVHLKSTDPDSLRYAESILTTSERAADLTTQLLAFARKGKYVVEPVDMHEIVCEVGKLAGRTVDKRIRIVFKLNAVSPVVNGDQAQLQNAVLNLAINARDAMPEGGEMVFETDTREFDEKRAAEFGYGMKPGEYLILSVTDTGTGMDEETRKKIFDPFFTTKEIGKGTGLGLASVYGTVKNHDGSIKVDSKPGSGSTFEILLPLAGCHPCESGSPSA